MKTLVGLIVAATATVCFADALNDGKMALDQKRYGDAAGAFNQSCEQGNANGCLNLAMMYEKGEGIAQNKYKASTLYAQACRAKEPLGCANMALSYDTP